MLSWLMPRRDSRRQAQGLYEAIVAQSRLPAFYRDLGVPDTVTGRFEMLVLHLFLILERLDDGPGGNLVDSTAANTPFGQALNEVFVADMDDAMREMGVADVRVGQRMHQTAGAYFGRLLAYRKAMTADAEAAGAGRDHLTTALARNVFADRSGSDSPGAGGVDASMASASVLATYMRRAVGRLAQTDTAAVRAGRIDWPAVEADAATDPSAPR